jgi:hypothetical protein
MPLVSATAGHEQALVMRFVYLGGSNARMNPPVMTTPNAIPTEVLIPPNFRLFTMENTDSINDSATKSSIMAWINRGMLSSDTLMAATTGTQEIIPRAMNNHALQTRSADTSVELITISPTCARRRRETG